MNMIQKDKDRAMHEDLKLISIYLIYLSIIFQVVIIRKSNCNLNSHWQPWQPAAFASVPNYGIIPNESLKRALK